MSNDPQNAELIRRILSEVKLPSLPDAAARMLELCRDPSVSAQEIVRVIELDPSLSAKLLRVANSAYFGQPRSVDTLTRAAVLLGNEYLKAVALGFFVTQSWQDVQPESFAFREFWRDSVLRACLARQMAIKTDYHPREQTFLIGLLADIGSLVMAVHFGSEYSDRLANTSANLEDRRAVEQKAFGVNHVAIGEALARHWSFPEAICTAIGNRLESPPLSTSTDRCIVLWQISHFCTTVPFAHDRQTARVCRPLRQLAMIALGLSFETLSDIFIETVEQFNVLSSVFSSLLPANSDVASLMEEASNMLREIDAEAAGRVSVIASE
jgi:HD-like signal output (HDOD) protein